MLFSAEDPILRAGTACVWSLNEAISILDQSDIILEKQDADRFSVLLRESLICWQYLAAKFLEANKRRWHLRPKHHVLDHFADEVAETQINPRLSCSCFQEESYLGHLKRIATKCSSLTVLERTFQRLLLFLSLRWQRARDWEQQLLQPEAVGSSFQDAFRRALDEKHESHIVLRTSPCAWDLVPCRME